MDILRIIMNIDKYVIIKGKRIDIACHTLLVMIFTIVVLGIVSTPIGFAAVYKTPAESSMKYYVHMVLVNQSGEILDEKTVELKEPPVKPPVKKVELVSVAVGNGTYLLIPKVKDLDKVRAATLRIWLFNSYNIVLPQDKKLDPDLVLNALNSNVTVVEKLGKAVMVVLHVEYVDGSNDSYLYIAAGYDILVS
ncbi:MAG: hypothetical protein QXQ57_00470 [Sulfolobales archaeon]